MEPLLIGKESRRRVRSYEVLLVGPDGEGVALEHDEELVPLEAAVLAHLELGLQRDALKVQARLLLLWGSTDSLEHLCKVAAKGFVLADEVGPARVLEGRARANVVDVGLGWEELAQQRRRDRNAGHAKQGEGFGERRDEEGGGVGGGGVGGVSAESSR